MEERIRLTSEFNHCKVPVSHTNFFKKKGESNIEFRLNCVKYQFFVNFIDD